MSAQDTSNASERPEEMPSINKDEAIRSKVDQMMIDRMFNQPDDPLLQMDKETLETMGTSKQKEIITAYPTQKKEDKLKIPYIEKQNGNLCITESTNEPKCENDDPQANGMMEEVDENAKYRVAISFYNKALLAVKMIFDGGRGNSVVVLDSQE